MKQRLALLFTPLVLVMALALPAATVAASNYQYKIVDQHCYGGQMQDVYFRVKITAAGTTTANKLTIKSRSQRFIGGKWKNYYTFPTDTDTYTPDGHAHSADFSYTHEGTNQYNWRIVSTLAAYHGTQKLSSKTLKSKAC